MEWCRTTVSFVFATVTTKNMLATPLCAGASLAGSFTVIFLGVLAANEAYHANHKNGPASPELGAVLTKCTQPGQDVNNPNLFGPNEMPAKCCDGEKAVLEGTAYRCPFASPCPTENPG